MYLILFSVFFQLSYSLIFQNMYHNLYKLPLIDVDNNIKIKFTENYYLISDAAKFIVKNTYTHVPNKYLNELIHLNKRNLLDNYGERVGIKKVPSFLLIAYKNNEIIGCVGINSHIFEKHSNIFRSVENIDLLNSTASTTGVIVPVLSNLVVHTNYRRQGIARLLLKHIEEQVKKLNYNNIYLLVDDDNFSAQKLYLSTGYKILIDDYNSTSIGYDKQLKTINTNAFLMSKYIL